MDLPDDQEGRLRFFKAVLQNELDRLVPRDPPEYILFRPRVKEWLRTELAAYGAREICRILYAHVKAGGEIDEQPEKRPEYAHFRFHYDLRVAIGGRRVYFETVLEFEDANGEDDLTIVVVNVHDV